MPSPTQQSRRISHDSPNLLTRAGAHQSCSPGSTDTTLRLSSKILLSPFPVFSHIVLLPPQSRLTSKETEPARQAWSSHGGSGARVHAPQPASRQHGRAACWGRPAGLKWVQTEGCRGGKAGEPTRLEEHRACGGDRSPQAAGRQLPRSPALWPPRGAAPELTLVAPSQIWVTGDSTGC